MSREVAIYIQLSSFGSCSASVCFAIGLYGSIQRLAAISSAAVRQRSRTCRSMRARRAQPSGPIPIPGASIYGIGLAERNLGNCSIPLLMTVREEHSQMSYATISETQSGCLHIFPVPHVHSGRQSHVESLAGPALYDATRKGKPRWNQGFGGPI